MPLHKKTGRFSSASAVSSLTVLNEDCYWNQSCPFHSEGHRHESQGSAPHPILLIFIGTEIVRTYSTQFTGIPLSKIILTYDMLLIHTIQHPTEQVNSCQFQDDIKRLIPICTFAQLSYFFLQALSNKDYFLINYSLYLLPFTNNTSQGKHNFRFIMST